MLEIEINQEIRIKLFNIISGIKWELLIIKSISKTFFNFKFLQVAIQKVASGAQMPINYFNDKKMSLIFFELFYSTSLRP